MSSAIRFKRLLGGGFGFLLVVMAGNVYSANGDLILTSTSLHGTEITGLCSAPDGTFWAVGETSDLIYQLNSNLQKTREIPNPHDVGTFPNLILSRGIALRPGAEPGTETLLILAKNGTTFQVKEVGTNGIENPAGAFDINTSTLPGANLYGLTFDKIKEELLMIDDNNDLVIRSNLSGTPLSQFSFPEDTPPEKILKGKGICFQQEGITPYIYITHGDIFTLAPKWILELTTNGYYLGYQIPLGNVPPDVPGSFVEKIGPLTMGVVGGKNAAVVAGKGGDLHALERIRPDPLPPSFFQASLTLEGDVILTWKNHGSGIGGSYLGPNGISISRNGIPLVSIGGARTEYKDESAPTEGIITYTIKGSNGGAFSPPVKAVVVVGKGGLINWIPFPGIRPYDATWNPTSELIYVTDSSTKEILCFDKNLVHQNTLPAPLNAPGGIAFIPDGNDGAGSLMVATSDGKLMREIDLQGNADLAIPIAFQDISNPQIGGMFYNPSTSLFTCVETSTHQLISFDRGGIVRGKCIPSEILMGKLEQGVSYDPYTGNLYGLFQDGVVHEVGPSCEPRNFSFNLNSLGEAHGKPKFAQGIEVMRNTLLICGSSVNALFQVLIYPQGQTFIRGDPNQDTEINLTDAVLIAEYLFKSGPAPICLDAADPNDDGEVDISDPVYLLFFLFLGGNPPEPPYPEPGNDPTFLDDLEC